MRDEIYQLSNNGGELVNESLLKESCVVLLSMDMD